MDEFTPIIINNIFVKMQIQYELDKIYFNKLDTQVIDYIQNNNIYNTKKTDHISSQILYKTAKELYTANKSLSLKMINQLDSKYFYGYSCFIAALNEDINTINHFILLSVKSYKLNNCSYEYIYRIIEIAFSIVNNYPYKALDLFNILHDIDEDCLPNEVLDLSVDIVNSIAQTDVNKALDLFYIIEIECFKLQVLNNMLTKTNEKIVISKINQMIIEIK